MISFIVYLGSHGFAWSKITKGNLDFRKDWSIEISVRVVYCNLTAAIFCPQPPDREIAKQIVAPV